MNKLKLTVAGAFVSMLLMGGLLTGCAQSQPLSGESLPQSSEVSSAVSQQSAPVSAPQSTPVSSSETSSQSSYRKLGTEGTNAFSVLLQNNTNKDISKLEIKSSGETKYSERIVPSGKPIERGETVQLFYTPSGSAETETANIDPDDPSTAVELKITYDIRLSFDDGSAYELYDFAFQDITEAQLYIEDGVAFVKYESKSTGEPVNTKNAQLAAKEKQEEPVSSKETKKQTTKKKKTTKKPKKPVQSTDECLEENIDWND